MIILLPYYQQPRESGGKLRNKSQNNKNRQNIIVDVINRCWARHQAVLILKWRDLWKQKVTQHNSRPAQVVLIMSLQMTLMKLMLGLA